MQCDLCQHNIDNHAAIYAAILDLEHSGELPQGAYNDIVYKVCELAECPILSNEV